jgi:prepilin-type processing-associated H-X9-DG protein
MVIACLAAVLAVILLPALVKLKARSSRIGCVNDMKQIAIAFRTWSLDNSDHFPMQVPVTNGGTMELVASGAVYTHFQVMSNELSTPRVLLCPNDTRRNYATNFTVDLTDKNISYFVNTSATNGDASSLLCGDRNITNRAPGGSRLVSFTKADSIGWTREIHSGKGNVAFGDDSVGSFTNGTTDLIIRMGSGKTNWLAVP